MATITLPPRCDRAAAEALLPHFAAASETGKIEVDGRQVEQVGQAVLQLLLSARRSVPGATIAPSHALAEAGRMTGLTAELFEEDQP